MNENEVPETHDPDPGDHPGTTPIIEVADWFQDGREVILDLNGDRYRLRLTKRQKLLLQK